MDPAPICCPHTPCPARGQPGQGKIGRHARQAPRCLCRVCHKTCRATTGPGFSRRRPAAELVVRVVTLLAPGGPVQALVAAVGLDERTVAAWWARAGRQGQAVHAYLVTPPRDLGQVQAEESRVRHPAASWEALARRVKPRVWRGGEVSTQRDLPLIRRLIARVRRGAARPPWLLCPDGLVASLRAMREPLRDPVHPGRGGQPRLRPWHHVVIAQVVKRYERRRVVETARRMVEGPPARVATLRSRSQGDGGINTADIEVRPVGGKEAGVSGETARSRGTLSPRNAAVHAGASPSLPGAGVPAYPPGLRLVLNGLTRGETADTWSPPSGSPVSPAALGSASDGGGEPS